MGRKRRQIAAGVFYLVAAASALGLAAVATPPAPTETGVAAAPAGPLVK
ncbi:MAG: hypothetical protein AAFR16_09630 [Pseudomonadota bacterium]